MDPDGYQKSGAPARQSQGFYHSPEYSYVGQLPTISAPAVSLEHQTASTQSTRQILSRDRWEELRPLIQRLYIDENKTFKAITEILREIHNFVPTKRQFTKRLAEWGLKKNASQTERDAVIQRLGPGSSVPQNAIEIDGRKVSRAKLTRWKKEAAREALARAAEGKPVIAYPEDMNIFGTVDKWSSTETLSISGTRSSTRTLSAGPATPLSSSGLSSQDCKDLFPSYESSQLSQDPWPWSSLDVPGSPKLSRLFAALKIHYPPDVDPLSLSDASGFAATFKNKEFITGSELKHLSQAGGSGKPPNVSEKTSQLVHSSAQSESLALVPPPSPFDEIYPFPPFAPPIIQYDISSGVLSHSLSYLQRQVEEYTYKMLKLKGKISDDHVKIIELKEGLAGTYVELGQYDMGKKWWEEVVNSRTRIGGRENRDTLLALMALLRVMRNKGETQAAENLHLQVHPVVMKSMSAGPVLLIESLSYESAFLASSCRFEESEKVWRQQLQIALTSMGPRHPTTLKTMLRMARSIIYDKAILRLRGSSEGSDIAEHLLRTALQLHREIEPGTEPLSGDNRSIEKYIIRNITVVADLVRVFRMEKQYEQSAELGQSVLDRLSAFLGEDHPSTLNFANELGITLREQGMFDKSEKILRKTLGSCIQTLGPKHMASLQNMDELGRTLVCKGRFHEASRLLEECMLMRLKEWGPTDVDTVSCCFSLQDCYVQQGFYDAALNLCHDLIEQTKRAKGDNFGTIPEIQVWIQAINNKYILSQNVENNWANNAIFTLNSDTYNQGIMDLTDGANI